MNKIFASLLRKYVSAKKISNSKLTQAFMSDHEPSEYKGYPEEITPEIKAFCKSFVEKDLRSKDPEFTKFVVDNSVSEEEPQRFVATAKNWSKGEY